jgi:hypothetical protein
MGDAQQLVGAAGLKGPQGIGCRCGGRNTGIEVASIGVRRRSRLLMPQHGAKRQTMQQKAKRHGQPRWAAAMRGLDPRAMTQADIAPVRANASVTQIWWTDASGRTHRSDYVAPLVRTQPTCRSDRTNLDTRGLRCIGPLEMPL